tara:strand:- start:1926 stop:3377 length:1452 start_codon:yes stop_codon:yes gene_type:complete
MKKKHFKELLKEGVARSRLKEWGDLDPQEESEELDEGILDAFKKVFTGSHAGEPMAVSDDEVEEIAGLWISMNKRLEQQGCGQRAFKLPVFKQVLANRKKAHPSMDLAYLAGNIIDGMTRCPDGSDFGAGGGETPGGETPGGEPPGGETPGGGEAGETGPDPSGRRALAKEFPLSIMKKQKDAKAGAGGKPEFPLVMYIQKLGVSQRSAQQLAKRVGEYLKQRNIPIAEAIQGGLLKRLTEKVLMESDDYLVVEDKDTDRLIKFLRGKMAAVLPSSRASDEKKERAAKFVMAVHSIANQRDVEKFKKFVKKRLAKAAKVGKGGWLANNLEDLDAISDEEWQSVMKFVGGRGDGDFKKYHQYGKELRQAKADKKGAVRADVRDVGKEAGVIGKIISRFVSDNQKMLEDDPALAKIMAMAPGSTAEDEAKFKTFIKRIRKMLARQLARRGYEEAEIGKLLETTVVNKAIIRYIRKEVQTLYENQK